MKLQFISDIHLENFKIFPTFQVVAPNLALLGDIGHPKSQIYKDFIAYCATNWTNVFVIYGNHEFYNYPLPKDKKQIQVVSRIKECNKQELSKHSNVYILDNDTVWITKEGDTVTFRRPDPQFLCNYIQIIGSTLWSYISISASQLINDYRYIFTDINKTITPTQTREMYLENIQYILDQLETPCETVLLTHHGIHDICNGKYQGGLLASAFATTEPDLFESSNLKVAINGHTHINFENTISNVKLMSNCFGYNKAEREGFDETRFLE